MTPQPAVDDTWTDRDLPVLRATVRLDTEKTSHSQGVGVIEIAATVFDAPTGADVSEDDIAAAAALNQTTVEQSLLAFQDAGWLHVRWVNGDNHEGTRHRVFNVSADARAAAGQWPTLTSA